MSVFIWETCLAFSCTVLFCLWCESNSSLIKSIWKWSLLSSFWKNLKRIDNNILNVCYNLPSKPCGPGLFLFGSILIANSIFLLVMGYSGFPWFFFFLIEIGKSRNLVICSTLSNLLTYVLHSSFFFFCPLIQNALLVFLKKKKIPIWFYVCIYMCVIFSISCFICICSGPYYFFPIDNFEYNLSFLSIIPWEIELVYLKHPHFNLGIYNPRFPF